MKAQRPDHSNGREFPHNVLLNTHGSTKDILCFAYISNTEETAGTQRG